MSDYSDATNAIVTKGNAAVQIMHDFANGGTSTIIQTESGPLSSLQKFLADNQEVINNYPELQQMLLDEIAARTTAQNALAQALADKQDRVYQMTTVAARLGTRVTAEEHGAVGDGVTDDYDALIRARNTGRVVHLADGKTYAIRRGIPATGNNQGFFCDGKATILLLTGAGQFDAANYSASRWNDNACGFHCKGFSNYTLYNVHIKLQPTSSVRTVIAARIAATTDSPLIRIEASGFKEAAGGVIAIDSVTNCDIDGYTHNCGTSNDTLPSMQITGLCLDDSRENGVDTTNTRIRAYGHDLTITGAALTKYGAQTDGFNISGAGSNKGVIWSATFDNVGECADIFGSDTVGVVNGSNIIGFGLKLIHGAQNNNISGVINTTGLAAVVLAGSNNVARPVKNNVINLSVSKICSLPTLGSKCVVWFDGPTLNQKPANNRVTVNVSDSPNAEYVTLIQAGSNNTVEYTTDLTKADRIITATSGTGNTIRRIRAADGGTVVPRHYGGYHIDLSSSATLALSPNVLYGSPFKVTGTLTADQIGVTVVTTGAGSARLGIYEWYSGQPVELLNDAGVISLAAAGEVTASLRGGEGLTLAPGTYFLGIVANVAATIRATVPSVETLSLVGMGNPGASKDVLMNRDFTYAALPNPFGAIRYTAANLPNIYLRRTAA